MSLEAIVQWRRLVSVKQPLGLKTVSSEPHRWLPVRESCSVHLGKSELLIACLLHRESEIKRNKHQVPAHELGKRSTPVE